MTIGGWKEKKLGDIEFFQCPGCKRHSESLSGGQDDIFQCLGCKEWFNLEQFERVRLKKEIAVCNICGIEVSLTPENSAGHGLYLCPKDLNVVAVCFEEEVYQPTDILKIKFNPNLKMESLRTDDQLLFGICNTDRHFLSIIILQVLAQEEHKEFRFADETAHQAGLLISREVDSYLGYVLWSEDGDSDKSRFATLRQIFIIKNERRKGYATSLLKFWVENIADRINDTFVVESPNMITSKILVKLGYAREEADELRGIKCRFTQGM